MVMVIPNYKRDLNRRYWEFQKSQFPDWQNYFEHPYVDEGRPPVFIPAQAAKNVITNPDALPDEIYKLLALVPVGERHKWFRSMNSSQALAQSIFGNLAIYNLLPHLSELKDDDGLDLFAKAQLSSDRFKMEHKISYLGEPRPTSLDVFFSGDYRIAIECKFTEAEVGTCSRPRLKVNASNYKLEYCNGRYSVQGMKKERCSLTEIGVLYWRYVPHLFKWDKEIDLDPCPLNGNYQLVRNLLAVGVKPDCSVSPANGHVILIYDARNPAFQLSGKGWMSYNEARQALKELTMLRKCSWQRIVELLRTQHELPWLTEALAEKYGL